MKHQTLTQFNNNNNFNLLYLNHIILVNNHLNLILLVYNNYKENHYLNKHSWQIILNHLHLSNILNSNKWYLLYHQMCPLNSETHHNRILLQLFLFQLLPLHINTKSLNNLKIMTRNNLEILINMKFITNHYFLHNHRNNNNFRYNHHLNPFITKDIQNN